MIKLKICELDPSKECNDCKECELCDLEPSKNCDNCCRCLGEADYSAIEITEIILPKEIKLKRKKQPNKLNKE